MATPTPTTTTMAEEQRDKKNCEGENFLWEIILIAALTSPQLKKMAYGREDGEKWSSPPPYYYYYNFAPS